MIDPDTRDYKGFTTLHAAACHGSTFGIGYLLDKGACVNGNGNQLTSLHIAIALGHTDAVNAFISRGAQVNVEREQKLTPLHVAARPQLSRSSPS